jgi:hypothetical protein
MKGRRIGQRKHSDMLAGWVTTGLRTGWSLLVLGLLASGALAAAAGLAGPALRECGPLVVTQLPAGSDVERQPSTSAGTLPLPYGEGSRLLLVRADGTTRVLSKRFQSAADPAISFDGQRLLFAAKRSASDRWNIYEMSTDGDDVRQITKGIGDCRRPRYLSTLYTIVSPQPWYQIVFVGTRARQLNEFGDDRATHLFSCKLDGSELRRLTDNMSSDRDPWLMQDGRLLFATWQRCTLDHGVAGRVRLAAINIDGTDLAAFVGEGGQRVQHMACTTAGGLAVFVEASRVPWDGAGRLACVALRRPLHSYRVLTTSADGLFHSPSPLADGKVLVSRRPADGSGTLGLWRFDPTTGQMAKVFDDPAYHDMQARQLGPRPEPDGRSSVVNRADPHATLYCLDIYQSDLQRRGWLPPGTARRLRVVAGTPRRAAARRTETVTARTPVTAERSRVRIPQMARRRVLGEVEIAADGSFQVEVPANTPIQLQLLDKEGIALRSCGWIWAKNHEPRGCIGCHEDGELTPANRLVEALTRSAASVCVPSSEQMAIDFRRDVMPIVSARCTGCHAAGCVVPDPAGIGLAHDDHAHRVYQALLAAGSAGGDSAPVGDYVHMGRARTSPLVWHLLGRNTSRPWDGPWASRPAKPIPPDSSAPIPVPERSTIVEWIDLGARWDGGPSPRREK